MNRNKEITNKREITVVKIITDEMIADEIETLLITENEEEGKWRIIVERRMKRGVHPVSRATLQWMFRAIHPEAVCRDSHTFSVYVLVSARYRGVQA